METNWLYEFTDDELAFCWQLALRRNGIKQRYGIPTEKFDVLSDDMRIHFRGAKGERAAAKLLGVHQDTGVYARGQKKGNLYWYSGGEPDGPSVEHRAMVRTRSMPGWDLALSRADMKGGAWKGELAILATPPVAESWDSPLVLAGWITREAFRERARLVDYLRGEKTARLAVGLADLQPMDELLERIAEGGAERATILDGAGLCR